MSPGRRRRPRGPAATWPGVGARAAVTLQPGRTVGPRSGLPGWDSGCRRAAEGPSGATRRARAEVAVPTRGGGPLTSGQHWRYARRRPPPPALSSAGRLATALIGCVAGQWAGAPRPGGECGGSGARGPPPPPSFPRVVSAAAAQPRRRAGPRLREAARTPPSARGWRRVKNARSVAGPPVSTAPLSGGGERRPPNSSSCPCSRPFPGPSQPAGRCGPAAPWAGYRVPPRCSRLRARRAAPVREREGGRGAALRGGAEISELNRKRAACCHGDGAITLLYCQPSRNSLFRSSWDATSIRSRSCAAPQGSARPGPAELRRSSFPPAAAAQRAAVWRLYLCRAFLLR